MSTITASYLTIFNEDYGVEVSRLKLLQEMPIFGGISNETLNFILEQSSITVVPKNRYFFREGDNANSMYVLEQGKVVVLKKWKQLAYKLRELSDGGHFGEMALIDLYPRSAAVKAVEDCIAIELTTKSLSEVYKKDMEQYTLIQMNMAREISRRLRDVGMRLFQAKVETKIDIMIHTI